MSLRQKLGTLSQKSFIAIMALMFGLALVVLPAIRVAADPLPTIRLNAGGGAYTDGLGRVWAADNSYSGGFTNSVTTPISGTTDDVLYQSERWNYAPVAPEMSYNFAVPAGAYQVRLHFAEIYGPTSQAGGRVFNVGIENRTVLHNFDVFSQAGANTALVKSFGVPAVDGTLNVRFMNGSANNPKISAIEVIPVNGSTDSWPEYDIAGPGQKVDMLVTGDSYTAGNGASTDGSTGYFFKSVDDPRTDALVRQRSANPPSRDCWRHHDTWGEYAHRLTRVFYGNVGAYVNTACSGDITENITGTNGNPPQLDGFTTAQRNDMDLVALTIGGNDLNFSSVVLQCFIANAGNACESTIQASEAMLVGTGGQYSPIQQKTLAALNKVKATFPNAKIMLIGYPVFWDNRATAHPCTNCAGGMVYPGQRLESGINALNLEQLQLVNDLNAVTPGKFGFMPLHLPNNQGFYDGHGLQGTKTPWIHSTTNPNASEWFHPTVAGYGAIGENLIQQPLVKKLFQ